METNNPNNTEPKLNSALKDSGWRGWKAELVDCFKTAATDLFQIMCFWASAFFYILIQGDDMGQKTLTILFNQGFCIQTVIFWIGFVIVVGITSKILQSILELLGRLGAFIAKVIWLTVVFLFKAFSNGR